MAVTDYRKLNDVQIDALKEIGNIGSGNAATSLSEILGKKVDMMVPHVDIMGYDEVMNLLGGPEVLASAVLVELKADMNGMMLFIQQQDFIVSLLSSLMGRELHDLTEIEEMDVSAILEIGNILISSYVNAISKLTGLVIDITVPSHTINMAGAILSVPIVRFAEESDSILIIRCDFIIDQEKFSCNLLMIPDLVSLNKILENLGVNIDG